MQKRERERRVTSEAVQMPALQKVRIQSRACLVMSSIDPIVSRSTRECGSAHSIVRLADPPSCSTACTAAHGNAGPQALISAARTLCKLYVHTRRGTKAGQTAFAFKSVRGFSAQTFRSLVTTRVHPFAPRATAHSEHTTRRREWTLPRGRRRRAASLRSPNCRSSRSCRRRRRPRSSSLSPRS